MSGVVDEFADIHGEFPDLAANATFGDVEARRVIAEIRRLREPELADREALAVQVVEGKEASRVVFVRDIDYSIAWRVLGVVDSLGWEIRRKPPRPAGAS